MRLIEVYARLFCLQWKQLLFATFFSYSVVLKPCDGCTEKRGSVNHRGHCLVSINTRIVNNAANIILCKNHHENVTLHGRNVAMRYGM